MIPRYGSNSLLTAEDFWFFCDLYLQKVRQTSVWHRVPKFWFIWLFIVPQRLTLGSNAKRKIWASINQNFGTVCHTEVCFTFSRLAAKLSEMIAKYQGRSLKIQHQSSFDLNGLKNGTRKYFENSLKSLHLFQRLMGAMNCR